MLQPALFEHPAFPDYALLDSGSGEKLERFGEIVLRRPDPQALWSKNLGDEHWQAADLHFVRESDRGGRWEARSGASGLGSAQDRSWIARFAGARFVIRPTPFKHVGLFPEQATNWMLVDSLARAFELEAPRLLNLFGYTGAASVLAARAGFAVTHVDASKTSIAWTRENAQASELESDRLRVVLDDALAFVRREVRRNVRYEVVLLDPPHHGRGPGGETWQFEEHITPLLNAVGELLGDRALVVLSTYAIGCSPQTLANLLGELGSEPIEAGELVLPEQRVGGRVLPAGFCARWSRGLRLEAQRR